MNTHRTSARRLRFAAVFSALAFLTCCTTVADIRQGSGAHEEFVVPQDFATVSANLGKIAANCFRPGPVAGYMGAQLSVDPVQKTGSLQLGWHRIGGVDVWSVADFHATDNGTAIRTAALTNTGGFRKFAPQLRKWVADPSNCDPDVSD
jgi:hypothetical protein